MQQNNQQIDLYQTDENDLKKLFDSLLKRKFFIFGFTTFVTLIAIIFSLTLTPIYKTVSLITAPDENSMIKINKLQLIQESKKSVFSNFLTELSSKEFQAKTFLDGGYLALFNPEKNSIDSVPDFISNILRSVNLSRPNLTSNDIDLSLYLVSMEGTNPELIARYLKELVERADKKVINELINNSNQKVSIRLNEISLEQKLLLHTAKQERLNEITILKDEASIAKSLGMIDNNFNQINEENITSNLLITNKNRTLPQWYLYGETSLLERINVLNSRENDNPFIPELVKLEVEKLKLESRVIKVMSNVNSMELNQIASTPINPIKPNKRMIVVTAFIGSFIMSIFLALIMGALRPDEQAA
jgi:LPS O-antigen subunit length determinant protein (WzzB/FepE family)